MDSAGHVRQQGSLLTGVEKRALIWLAQRMPRVVTSDHLTALGLAAMAVAGLSLWASSWLTAAPWLAIAALAVNWFGDSLDGTVARVRHQQRPRYGFYVDHVIDIVGAFLLFGGLGLSPFMSPTMALVLLVAYLMVSAELYLATHACGVFRLDMVGIGPTELRLLLAGGIAYATYRPLVTIAGGEHLLFDVAGLVATVGMFGALIGSTIRNTVSLYRAEPIPVAPERRP